MNTQGNEKFIYKTAHTVDSNILKAIKAKNDEWITMWPDIAAEVPNYKSQLKGQRILCPNIIKWKSIFSSSI